MFEDPNHDPSRKARIEAADRARETLTHERAVIRQSAWRQGTDEDQVACQISFAGDGMARTMTVSFVPGKATILAIAFA